MQRIQLKEDIQPLSEFRSKVAYYFDKIKSTKRPLIITQNGKSAAVLLDVSEYESMVDKIELLGDIETSEKQIERGQSISNCKARKKLIKGEKEN